MTDPLDICPEIHTGPAPERDVAGLLIHTEREHETVTVAARSTKVLCFRNGIDLYEHLKTNGYEWRKQ